MDLCMDYTSFVYETCAGDHNIYAPICNKGVIEHLLKTTKTLSEELNRRAYDEARISISEEYRNK
jgi:DNA polymerase II large subunit